MLASLLFRCKQGPARNKKAFQPFCSRAPVPSGQTPAITAMHKTAYLLLLLLAAGPLAAQENTQFLPLEKEGFALPGYTAPLPKLRQRNYGAIIGIQRGHTTAIEMGGEMHWRKIGLRKPHIWGATANIEYSFAEHIVGYKAGVWRKQGRVNLTYGGNVVYFNNFEGGHQFGIGPSVGFRLFGLHLVNGVNILMGDMNKDKSSGAAGANTLYMSLRYYFPLQNKFVWDRKDKKKKEGGLFGKKEAPEERKGLFGLKKKAPEPERKGLFRKKQEAAPKERERKGLRDLFRKDD